MKSKSPGRDTNQKPSLGTIDALVAIRDFAMNAIVYRFVRRSAHTSNLHVSDFATIACFSLGGLVLALVLAYFGLDVGAEIPS
jgi:hypothetical protein